MWQPGRFSVGVYEEGWRFYVCEKPLSPQNGGCDPDGFAADGVASSLPPTHYGGPDPLSGLKTRHTQGCPSPADIMKAHPEAFQVQDFSSLSSCEEDGDSSRGLGFGSA